VTVNTIADNTHAGVSFCELFGGVASPGISNTVLSSSVQVPIRSPFSRQIFRLSSLMSVSLIPLASVALNVKLPQLVRKREDTTLPIDEGAELNARVSSVFENAGFETQPNSINRTEHAIELDNGIKQPVDLYAREPKLNLTIVGSNKSGTKIDGFHDHIAGLKALGEAADANVLLFVATGRELTEKDMVYLRKRGIHFWTERQLAYYESLVHAIGTFAKYELIHSFGVRTAEQTVKITVPALALKQPRWLASRKIELYVFVLPADVLLEMGSVLRRARDNAFTYQRILLRKRLPRIADFLKTSTAILPTCIVAHLSDTVDVENVERELHNANGKKLKLWQEHHVVSLTIPREYSSLEIIDGQHRLFGFVHTSKRVRENFNLIVVGIRNLPESGRSKTFVAINDKAKRVDPSLVSFLRYSENENKCQKNPDLMAIKIAVELNKRPPFKNAIRLWDFGPQTITLKGISGYDLKGMVGENGSLRRYYPNKSAAYVGALKMYFSAIEGCFETEWKNPKTYIIATNRGIAAFLKLLKSILKNEGKCLDEATIRKYLQIIKNHWVKRTWITSKLDTSYTASQGWKQFHRDLVRTIRQEKPGFRE
jgi:DGQHR domain-containing protein